jgi:hypothetical protein
LLRGLVEAFVFGYSGSQTHGFAQAVKHVQLVVLDTGDLQAKTI